MWGGGGLNKFLQLGFNPHHLYGIDILEERIEKARLKYPNINFACDDATNMPYESEMFDLVLESTMFVQLTDKRLSHQIAEAMLRVTKSSGYILLIDWRYSKPRNSAYLGVSKKRINEMFAIGSSTHIICQTQGALIPPVGRFLSQYLPSFYFLTGAIFPFLVGLQSTLYRKNRYQCSVSFTNKTHYHKGLYE